VKYSETVKMLQSFEEWQEKHHATPRSLAILTFLNVKGWLNEDKVRKDLKCTESEEVK
jgi:hypothetical protein